MGQVVEVMNPVAQVGIGNLAHARPDVVLHALHRRFRGQAGFDALLDSLQPTGVLGNQAVGFEHVRMFTVIRQMLAGQHVVDGAVHFGKGSVQPLGLHARVIGDHFSILTFGA